ncbi:hypothetical protein [Streptococcus suis]|uniref:hypothetical protein n=1 Tax=Streptococcus suis TaxID=1307 RepID=UPI001EF067A5|nr:hypothetical protein [Streptococcus suis]MDG3139901.1 hypothetical protein [Streptococcus suis]MDG3149954.1 hypothetical protein [Streptococcus suis]MDG3155624.1 hypothetical protein [Streptococcus suis]MDG3262997.1 hypothetical protein [Streptococcus suis]
MKITLSSTVAEHTLQNEATNFDIALITYSEMSKKDFKLKCSSSLEDMIIGHEEREKAPVFLVLKINILVNIVILLLFYDYKKSCTMSNLKIQKLI